MPIATILSLTLTLLMTVAAYFLSPDRSDSLLVALIGIGISVSIDSRDLLGKLTRLFDIEIANRTMEDRIKKFGKYEPMLISRFDEIQNELDLMSHGKCRLQNLNAVYDDDILSIKKLGKGDQLLSTCPVSSVSDDDRMRQINDPRYLASIESHTTASRKGVHVNRLYLFRNKIDLGPDELVSHLKSLGRSRMTIKIAFRDELDIPANFDFVIFGSHKVSIGEIDGDTGVVQSGLIDVDDNTVKEYTQKYNAIFYLCKTIDEME